MNSNSRNDIYSFIIGVHSFYVRLSAISEVIPLLGHQVKVQRKVIVDGLVANVVEEGF